MADKLVQIELGVQRWALAFVGGTDTGNQPKSCFNCAFMYAHQKRCQIHGADIIIDRVTKDGAAYTPVCCYQRGGTPLAVGDDKVIYNATTLGAKAADQTGLEWAKSATGTNCGGYSDGAPCEYFDVTDGKGIDGVCRLMSEQQDATSNSMSDHKGRSVDWDDCCDGHKGEAMDWRQAQQYLNQSKMMSMPKITPNQKKTEPEGPKLVALFMRHGQTEANKERRFRGAMEIPLDSVGRQQALDARRFLAGYLGDKPLGPAYSSSKDRAKETANLALGPGKSSVIKDLDALNVGKFSGQKKTDENMKAILHYQNNPTEKIPGGERLNDFRARVNPNIQKLIKEGEETGKPPIAFVHSSTIHQVSHLIHGDHNQVKVTPGGIVGVFKRPSGSYYVHALLNQSKGSQDQLMS